MLHTGRAARQENFDKQQRRLKITTEKICVDSVSAQKNSAEFQNLKRADFNVRSAALELFRRTFFTKKEKFAETSS